MYLRVSKISKEARPAAQMCSSFVRRTAGDHWVLNPPLQNW